MTLLWQNGHGIRNRKTKRSARLKLLDYCLERNSRRQLSLIIHDLVLQILRVLITILDTSSDPRALAVACFDLSQFIQHHPAGRIIVTDLKAKERVMKLMIHENAEVTKNALLCIQRLFLGAKYASFLQA